MMVAALAGCGTQSVGGGLAPERQASGFKLHVMDESFIEGASVQDMSLSVDCVGDTVVASVNAAGAKHLKALFFDLAYDPAQYRPVSCEATEALGREPDVLRLSVLKEAGKVYGGQILANPQWRTGFTGSAVLARVTFRRGRAEVARAASHVPVNDAAQTLVTWDDASKLTWLYCNQGDCDQNGEVNLSDLMPIAAHFLQATGGGPFNPARVEWLIDSDSNGVINLADVVAIARNFKNRVEGYNVYHSLDPATYPTCNSGPSDPTRLLSPTPAMDSPVDVANWRRQFTYIVTAPVPNDYIWVRPTDGTNDGTPSKLLWTGGAPGDWWMFGRDRQHTRRSPFVGAQTATVKWRYLTGTSGFSSPAIGADGTVFVGGSLCLNAINPDGTLMSVGATHDLVISSPAIGADGTVYVGSVDESVYAFRPHGRRMWSYATGGVVYSSPAIGKDGTVYVGSDEPCFYALHPDGTLKWKYPTSGQVFLFSPAIAQDGIVYFGSRGGNLYAFHPDGALKWTYPAGHSLGGSPAVGEDGTVYVGCLGGSLLAVKPDGTLGWTYPTGADVQSSPAIAADGTIYVGSDNSYLNAIKPDGTLKWQYRTEIATGSSPAIGADGLIYVGGGYRLYAIKPDGTLKWSYLTGGAVFSSPAIAEDGTVYVGSADGYLYAFADP